MFRAIFSRQNAINLQKMYIKDKIMFHFYFSHALLKVMSNENSAGRGLPIMASRGWGVEP